VEPFKKHLILSFSFAALFIAFNELVVLPYQIAKDYWDFYNKAVNAPPYMGLLHLGPSVLLFSLSAMNIVKLMNDIEPDQTGFFKHKEIGTMRPERGVWSGSALSEAVNEKGGAS